MKVVYLVLGYISLALGIIGIALPVLPTTPFLLLTAFLFSKGSKKFHKKFVNSKLYKNHLEEFVQTRSMPLKKKVSILAIATMFLLIAFFMVDFWHAKVAILLVIIFKYYYFIFRIKTTK